MPTSAPPRSATKTFAAPEWLVTIGAAVFIAVLYFSAAWEADIRWLHFFQSWMYMATIALALRHSRWGYFIGISAAGFWDYGNLFVTTFFANGMRELAGWISTGHLRRPDQLIAVPAFTSNLLVIVGCLWAYARLRNQPGNSTQAVGRDLLQFLLTFAATTGFFALSIALLQPRYLGLFRGALHPHGVW